jgi:hypothetical protein
LFVCGADAPAAIAQNRKVFDWQPTGPRLLTDLEKLVVDGLSRLEALDPYFVRTT